MENTAFGTRERALLLGLMTLGGEASNPELRDHIGDALDGAARRKALSLGLVEGEKRGRSFHHKLTDKGWAWCVAELSNTPPARGGSFARTLYAVLATLDGYLDATDLSLGEFITTSRKATAAPLPADPEADDALGALAAGGTDVAASSSSGLAALAFDASAASGTDLAASTATVSAAVSTAAVGAVASTAAVGTAAEGAGTDLADLVREAYWRLAREPQDWVSLTRLRPLLGNASRQEVDETLRRMERLPDVHLVPEADQKTLTGDDRAAAVLVGGVSKHLLAIEAP
ncbi:hypothetical protein [Actinocorallia libanotica]|uniref:Uncharacterized protein n=1 Tax=Actinocorallia libanotica TaxID=46162 RepID=A0ABP4C5V4_9ACTN